MEQALHWKQKISKIIYFKFFQFMVDFVHEVTNWPMKSSIIKTQYSKTGKLRWQTDLWNNQYPKTGKQRSSLDNLRVKYILILTQY